MHNLLAAVDQALQGFRAAPLSPTDQVRRANQLLRFLALVPVEYGRGVRNGTVTVDLEIREAITFRDSAAAAFADLRSLLDERDAIAAANADQLFNELGTHLTAAGAGTCRCRGGDRPKCDRPTHHSADERDARRMAEDRPQCRF